jgi:hypothetical protein
MDRDGNRRDGNQKSNLGNDSKLDREKTKVTGVRTNDQLQERRSSDETGGHQKSAQQGSKMQKD